MVCTPPFSCVSVVCSKFIMVAIEHYFCALVLHVHIVVWHVFVVVSILVNSDVASMHMHVHLSDRGMFCTL